jgi:type I restriction enzyme, S subunit
MNALPKDWVLVPLQDLVRKLVDGSHNPPEKKPVGLPMLSAINIANNKVEFSTFRLIDPISFANEDRRTRVSPGDVLLTIVGAIGRTAIVPAQCRPFTLQRSVAVISPILLDPKFLMYQLEAPQLSRYLKDNARGTAQKGVYLKTLGQMRILLPPLPEQSRIVVRIEELLSELDEGVESLTTARQQLNAYRQSVLKHAFEGKLTADWRSKNPDRENGTALRRAILKARREEWEKAEKARLKEQGRLPSNNHWKARYTEPEGFDGDELPSLPDEWCWAGLDEMVSGKPRSMQSGPFGSNLLHSEFQTSGVLVLGIDNVRDGTFSTGSQNRISEEKFQDLEKYQARPGDLLVTVMASLGRTCIVPRDLEKAIITKHVYRISMEDQLLFPEYFNLLLQSQTVSRLRMFENAQGQTRPGLNSSILKALPIPLCSRKEQVEIVSRLSSQLSNIDFMIAQIDDELSRTTVLRHSILNRAFSGQLVTQDPSDEPASVLLERIRAEKEEGSGARKKNNDNGKKEAA